MIAILQRYNWSKFGVVAAEMAGAEGFLKQVREEVADATNKSAKYVTSGCVYPFRYEIMHEALVKTSNASDVIEKLGDLKKSQAKIILLYATTAQTRTIFEVLINLSSRLSIGSSMLRQSE